MHNGMLVDSACTFTMCVCGGEYHNKYSTLAIVVCVIYIIPYLHNNYCYIMLTTL